MRNRLLVSAAILAAGATLASAQHAPDGGAGQYRPQARKHDPNSPPAAQHRRLQPQHAAAKHTGEPSNAENSQHNARSAPATARHNELPPAPPHGARGHGDRYDGMAIDRSIWDRALAQGRAQSERFARTRQGRSQATAAAPGDHRAARAPHVKDHTKDHVLHQEAHRPPGHAAGRANEKELKAHSAAPPHPRQENTLSSSGGQADIRKAQAALNQQGFNVGDLDGKLGQRTKKALIAFQKQHGFEITGKVDRATLEALNAGAGANKDDHAAGRSGTQQTPAQAAPQNPAVPATTGQGSPIPAAPPQQQPAEGETPPTAVQDGHQLPDASNRVPAGSPQEDYKDDLLPSGNDQR
jgi:hypothetical protein